MQRSNSTNWLPILAGALAAQILLAVALGFWSQRQSAAAPQSPLISVDPKTIDRLAIDGPVGNDDSNPQANGATQRVELARKDNHWILPGSFDAPADDTKVRTLLEKLEQGKRGSPVGSTSESQRRFHVADNVYERHLVAQAGGKTVAELWVGSATVFRKTAVRVASDGDVYAIDLANWDVPSGAGEWLDNGLVKVDPATLTRIDITGSKASLGLEHETGDKPGWKAVQGSAQVAKGRELNTRRAQALADMIGRLRIDGVLGNKPQDDWNVDKPSLRLVLATAKGEPVTWSISKMASGDDYVLKASDKPWYFQLKNYTGKPLLEGAEPDQLFAKDEPPPVPKAPQKPRAAQAPRPVKS
jgi:hypothetical protein